MSKADYYETLGVSRNASNKSKSDHNNSQNADFPTDCRNSRMPLQATMLSTQESKTQLPVRGFVTIQME